jgi:cell wall-associated NlpC family hydrolase
MPQANSLANSLIASTALQYQGKVPYVYGGSSPKGWDCSGFVNWVLGHDLNMVLPGLIKRGWNGTGHGPVVVNYASWNQAEAVATPETGDLCIWVGVGVSGHIGIATSPVQMISALNPALGTIVTQIQGAGPPAPLIYKRVTAAGFQNNGCLG